MLSIPSVAILIAPRASGGHIGAPNSSSQTRVNVCVDGVAQRRTERERERGSSGAQVEAVVL